MFKKPFIDLQSFEKEIYQKNNLLIKPLKIKDIKKRYIQSLKDKEINQYLISKKKKKLNKNHIYKYVSENNFYDVLNIGGEKSIDLMDFIKVIENKLGLKAKINFMPKQLGDVEKTESDCSKITSLVNYKPKVSIEDGISNFIDWYKEYYL